MRVRHPRSSGKILKVLSEEWQTSEEISYKSDRSAPEVSTFMGILERLGYAKSKKISLNVKAWRLKDGVTRELVAEELKLRRKKKRR